jgi:hypothetical protein
VPRNCVDEDPDRTCSHGLHVCSFDYLPHFSHANGHVVVCKVNPADVVAIPRDYNNTKMRVCRYEVVGEYEGYYSERGDRYGNLSVASGSQDPEDFPFQVRVYRSGIDSPVDSRFELLSEAASEAEALLEDAQYGGYRVMVVNTTTDTVVLDRLNVCPSEDDDEDDEDDEDDLGIEREERYDVEVEFGDGTRRVHAFGIASPSEARRIAAEIDENYWRVHVRESATRRIVFTITQDQ